jgi:adenylate cyclase
VSSRLTLGALFWASAAGLLLITGGLGTVISAKSNETVMLGANRLSNVALIRATAEVDGYIGSAKTAVEELEQSIDDGSCPLDPPEAIRSCLMSKLMLHPNLDSVGFTHGEVRDAGDNQLEVVPYGHWSVDVYRESAGAGSTLCTRRIDPMSDGGFVDHSACQSPEQALLAPSYARHELGDGGDPTDTYSFSTPALGRGRTHTTDLFQSPHDPGANAKQPRLVLSFTHSVDLSDGGVPGVLHVDLVFDQLSQIVRDIQVNPEADSGFDVFLLDSQDKFISGYLPEDRPVEGEDYWEVDPGCYPGQVQAAADTSLVQALIDPDAGPGTLRFDGGTYLVSFRPIPDTRSWKVGIVGPEDFYFGELRAQRRTALLVIIPTLFIFALVGLLTLRAIRRSLEQVQLQTDRISRFDFAGSKVESPFADVRAALSSIERAKTAVRAMGKYVPLDLVKKLFKENVEPVAGGDLREISMMFSDIEGFTTLVEKEPPERLATWLGHYLSTMTAAVHSTHGTVDKFIGDAVMALWNAPTADEAHVLNACRGALACIEATRKLFQSKEWAGRPALVTRFGLHCGQVMVGNFGAPDRLSYTAIGDAVNLASRLEGLNKEYGTQVLVSEAVWRRAQSAFAFRRIDRVAVKGKAEAIEVYELLGEKHAEPPVHVRKYEEALAAYFARDFARAAQLLEDASDSPSRVLHGRCNQMRESPPPEGWNGVWVLHTK